MRILGTAIKEFKRSEGVFKVLPLAVLYAGLVLGALPGLALYWFLALVASIIVYTSLALVRKKDAPRALSLLSWGLLIAGYMEITGRGWVHMAYIPYVLFIALFTSSRVLAVTMLSVPLLETRHLLGALGGGPESIHEELSLLGLVAVTAAVTLVAKRRLADVASREDNGYISAEGLENEPDEEIKEALNTAMHTVRPDSATLFLVSEGELTLRCSTESGMRLLAEGLVHEAFSLGQTIVSNSMRRERLGTGYAGMGRVASLAAAPVMDGSIVLGVLAADSEKEDAFGEGRVKALELFANQIARIMGRRRIQAELERANLGHKVLYEESARLISALELDELVEIALDGMQSIAPLNIAFFLKVEEGYEFIRGRGVKPPRRKVHSLSNTLAGTAVNARQAIYLSSLKGHSMSVLPFGKSDAASTFILPLLYEDEVLGVVVFLSGQAGPLTPLQTEHLEVLGNQSAISLKNAMLHAEIKRMAVTDGLTGLNNHKNFHERLGAEIRRFQRTLRPFSLLLMDIDFFKKINDAYGHQAGDEVLREVAEIVKKALRDIDMAARYGGEEFAVLLIDTDKKGAASMAERLRKRIMKSAFNVDGNNIKVTVSIGVASCREDAEGTEELIAKADRALYRAKEAGRNRVVPSVDAPSS
jgi:diguanylate cyclase (GGDEF)-like protein